MSSSILPLIFLAVVGLIVLSLYNGLIRKKNQVRNAFSSIDVMLKKRHDLIPNLIESVKKYMNHERELLTEIVRLRSQIVDNNQLSDSDRIKAENQLSQKLSGLQVNIENYPDLKSNQNFLQLQASLNEVEAQLSAARRSYNASVLDFNNGLETFPSSIMANMMGLRHADFFEIAEAEAKNPNVGELFG